MKYSSNNDLNDLLRRAEPYCTKIERGKHIKCYLKTASPQNIHKLIVVSSTGSDIMFLKQVKRDFRRAEIIL